MGVVAHALASKLAALLAVWAAVLGYVADVFVRRNHVAQQPTQELHGLHSSSIDPQAPEEYARR